jgi:hypothetical protein
MSKFDKIQKGQNNIKSKGETAEFYDFNQIFNQKNQFNQKIDLIKNI